MMKHMKRTALTLLLATAAAACGDGAGPPPPVPGTYDVFVASAHAEDQAVLVTVGSQLDNFTPAAGFQQFRNTTAAGTTLLIVAGAPLPAGENLVGSFTVPDIEKFTNVTAAVTEVAAADYSLRSDLGGYIVRLQKR
jgi:hypothetical protein